jgi:hypothetical protein
MKDEIAWFSASYIQVNHAVQKSFAMNQRN